MTVLGGALILIGLVVVFTPIVRWLGEKVDPLEPLPLTKERREILIGYERVRDDV